MAVSRKGLRSGSTRVGKSGPGSTKQRIAFGQAIDLVTISTSGLATWQRRWLDDLRRLARIREDILADHAQRHLLQVGAQLGVKLLELRPQHIFHKTPWPAQHHGRTSLAWIAIGRNAVAPAQRQKQVPRPGVGHGELELG